MSVQCDILGGTPWKREERALKGVVVKLTWALFTRSSLKFQSRATHFSSLSLFSSLLAIQQG